MITFIVALFNGFIVEADGSTLINPPYKQCVLYLHQEPAELFERLDQTLISDFPDDEHVDWRLVPGEPLAGRVLDVPGTQVRVKKQSAKTTNAICPQQVIKHKEKGKGKHYHIILRVQFSLLLFLTDFK